MRKQLSLALLLAVVATGVAVAGDAPTPAKRRENKDRVEVAGTMVSLGATLEAMGADAQETLNYKGALVLQTADGTLWTLVDNAKGHGLIHDEKLKGKEVKLLGWRFPKAQHIEVSKYQLKDGDKWVAYDYCKNCGWEPGDHHDTDLCEECNEGAKEGGKEGK